MYGQWSHATLIKAIINKAFFQAELLMQLNAAKSDANLLKTKSDEQQLAITQRDNALQSKQ